jgi:hypothetical protein
VDCEQAPNDEQAKPHAKNNTHAASAKRTFGLFTPRLSRGGFSYSRFEYV